MNFKQKMKIAMFLMKRLKLTASLNINRRKSTRSRKTNWFPFSLLLLLFTLALYRKVAELTTENIKIFNGPRVKNPLNFKEWRLKYFRFANKDKLSQGTECNNIFWNILFIFIWHKFQSKKICFDSYCIH